MILVSGYYGFGNLGDEAILAALCEDLEDLGIKRNEIVVLSADPGNTEEKHGVLALPRYDFYQIWRALGLARFVISGGGSLLQDVTSKRSLPYYLGIVELAFLRKVPVALYAQGLGPISWGLYQKWVKRAFARSAGFTVRDQSSARFLHSLGVTVGLDNISADPVFKWGGKAVEKRPLKTLLLNLRPYAAWQKERSFWLKFIEEMQEKGLKVEFIPLGPGDDEIGRNLQREIRELHIHPPLTLQNCTAIFKKSNLCISMRLHGIIFSALHNVLPVGINYDPKVLSICEQLNIICCETDDLAALIKAVAVSLEEYSVRQKKCEQALLRLAELTSLNRHMLAGVLNWSEENGNN